MCCLNRECHIKEMMNGLSATVEQLVKMMGSEVKCSLIIRLTAISDPYPSLSVSMFIIIKAGL